jgi:hypothetical protein
MIEELTLLSNNGNIHAINSSDDLGLLFAVKRKMPTKIECS